MVETLWTIQHLNQWEIAQRKGYIISDEQFIDPDYVNAYNWITNKMKKLPNPYKSKFPIWAWYRFDEKKRKPDLRQVGHYPKGEKAVLIEFKADLQHILLTDFDEWHMVLNSRKKEIKKGYLQDGKDRYYYDDIIIGHSNKVKMACNCIQATLWNIQLNDVIKTKEFTGR